MIPKRVFWLGVGMSAGAGATVAVQRKVKKILRAASPTSVPARVASSTRAARRSVRDAFGEGRTAMRQRETELRERFDPAPPMPTRLRVVEPRSGN